MFSVGRIIVIAEDGFNRWLWTPVYSNEVNVFNGQIVKVMLVFSRRPMRTSLLVVDNIAGGGLRETDNMRSLIIISQPPPPPRVS